jgi:aspartyl-tRNA(Asn)/glutamyl-tRNA(Gln) amidotransferase subunit A
LGKTTTPECGWRGSTDNTLTGITRNPLNLTRTPGGSSGGASASLAAYQGAFAIGTDGGGSIRIPCAFTGTVGIKAHFGRVPAFPASPMGTVAHVGPMTRSVMDCALMLNVISQPDDRDWLALPPHQYDYTMFAARGATVAKGAKPLKGLRIAYSPRMGHVPYVHAAVEQAVARAANDFELAGAIVEQADPGFDDCTHAFRVLWMSAARQVVCNLPAEQFALLDPGLQDAVKDAARYDVAALAQANQQRAQVAVKMREFHRRYDLLLTPSLSVPAFHTGLITPPTPAELLTNTAQFDWTWWTPFSYPFNLTQAPAISIPCGALGAGADQGLPISLQLVAPNHREDLCFLAAAAFEAMG